jgi:hypothetical protein
MLLLYNIDKTFNLSQSQSIKGTPKISLVTKMLKHKENMTKKFHHRRMILLWDPMGGPTNPMAHRYASSFFLLFFLIFSISLSPLSAYPSGKEGMMRQVPLSSLSTHPSVLSNQT